LIAILKASHIQYTILKPLQSKTLPILDSWKKKKRPCWSVTISVTMRKKNVIKVITSWFISNWLLVKSWNFPKSGGIPHIWWVELPLTEGSTKKTYNTGAPTCKLPELVYTLNQLWIYSPHVWYCLMTKSLFPLRIHSVKSTSFSGCHPHQIQFTNGDDLNV